MNAETRLKELREDFDESYDAPKPLRRGSRMLAAGLALASLAAACTTPKTISVKTSPPGASISIYKGVPGIRNPTWEYLGQSPIENCEYGRRESDLTKAIMFPVRVAGEAVFYPPLFVIDLLNPRFMSHKKPAYFLRADAPGYAPQTAIIDYNAADHIDIHIPLPPSRNPSH